MSEQILLKQLLSNTEEIEGFLVEAAARLENMIVYTGQTEELSEVQLVLQKIEHLVQEVTEDLSITIEGYLEYAQSILKEALVLVQSVEGNLDMAPIGGSR